MTSASLLQREILVISVRPITDRFIPALSQLTKDGFVVFTDEVIDGKPPRKIYSITDKGRSYLFNTLNKQPGPDRFKSEFLFYSLFQDKMSPEDFRKLLVRKNC